MFIKQITIHGFKSYRDETVIGPLHPGHNVVVGRNGSGKSNFFAAIRFVLNDAYTKLNATEERSSLIYESSSSTGSAFVEVVFDNGEGRFPTGKEETRIRRTVGLKRDEFQVDGKAVPRGDVENLLQSAGFSRANPYYIVPQGRVTALCNATDQQRLSLLKEVAGTKVYEEHRLESVKILEETRMKREKISELLEFIGERLAELEGEKGELAEYEAVDKKRRALEMTLCQRELQEYKDQLEKLQVPEEQEEKVKGMLERIQSLEEQLSVENTTLASLNEQMQALREEVQERKQAELEMNFAAQQNLETARTISKLEKELQTVEKSIEKKEDRMGELFPGKQRVTEDLAPVQAHLSKTSAQQQALQAKKQRTGQFKSQAERDKHIKAELESLQEQLEQHEQQAATVQEELKGVELREKDIMSDLNSIADKNKEQAEKAQERSKKKNELLEEQREITRKQGKVKQALSSLETEYQRTLPNNAESSALQSVEIVKGIAKTLGLPVFGALYELFQVDPAFRLATDVIAGNSLFHVVVPDDNVAATLMQALAKEPKGGRVTFVPLNRITPPTIPKLPGSEAVPLMSRIRPIDPIIVPALQQVFGKAVVVPDLKTGAQIARQYQVTAVTLVGDRADRKGALTGGWLDVSRTSAGSRLGALTRLMESKSRMDQCLEQLASLDASLVKCKKMYEECVKENAAGVAGLNSQVLERELESVKRVKSLKTKSLHEAVLCVQSISAKIECLEKELSAPFKDWTAKDEADLLQLSELSKSLEGEKLKLEAAKTKLEREWSALEDELALNLSKKRLHLLSQLAQAKSQLVPTNLHAEEEMIEDWDEEAMNAQIATLENSIKELEETLERCKQDLYAGGDKGGMEKYLSKRAAILQRKEECTRKIRDLGLLTQSDLQPYSRLSEDTILAQLQTAQRELKRFGPVNKRAMEQATSFTRQSEGLRKREEELSESEKSILEFIETLDRRKDEAIMRTFETVAENFSRIWCRLVPQGRAELLINTTSSNVEEKENQASKKVSNKKNETSVEFKGIGLKVSFQTGDNLMQSQLSGGQKSLVALCLIFAIQQCDPAPFYLFDEVDANLDAAYRQALAEMLREEGQGGQYVVTTFRPELVQGADKCWGVVCRDRVSGVVGITREDAMTFVVQTPIHP